MLILGSPLQFRCQPHHSRHSIDVVACLKPIEETLYNQVSTTEVGRSILKSMNLGKRFLANYV